MSTPEQDWFTVVVSDPEQPGRKPVVMRPTKKSSTAEAWIESLQAVRPHLSYEVVEMGVPTRAYLIEMFGPTTPAEQEEMDAKALAAWEASRQK